MISKNDSLYVYHDDNGSFTDYSHKLTQFGRDSITISIANATDYVYGHYPLTHEEKSQLFYDYLNNDYHPLMSSPLNHIDQTIADIPPDLLQ